MQTQENKFQRLLNENRHLKNVAHMKQEELKRTIKVHTELCEKMDELLFKFQVVLDEFRNNSNI